jgi:hypothetical protein
MTLYATGTFDVKPTARPPNDATGGVNVGSYALDKQFHGDLEAASKGEMLGAPVPYKGNAGFASALNRIPPGPRSSAGTIISRP